MACEGAVEEVGEEEDDEEGEGPLEAGEVEADVVELVLDAVLGLLDLEKGVDLELVGVEVVADEVLD